MTASLKVLEASIMARLAAISDDQRTKVVNSAIDIVRSQNAGWEAEAECVSSGNPASVASDEFGKQMELVAPELCCEVEKLPGKLRRGLNNSLNHMIDPQPHEAAKELGGLAGTRTQFPCSGVGGLRLDRSPSLYGGKRGAEREAELDLPRDAFGRLRKRVDELEAFVKWAIASALAA
jgi:hypothetical protein